MCKLEVDQGLGIDGGSIMKLRLNSPHGGWFPTLQTLSWPVTEHNLNYTDLFFSRSLERISIHLRNPEGKDDITLCNLLQSMASAISALPVSDELQVFTVTTSNQSYICKYFTESLSRVVLRCGASLVKFRSMVSLSDEATIHMISLPNLRTLRFDNPPPESLMFPTPDSPMFPPLIFAPLTECIFEDDTAAEWLAIFQRFEDGVNAQSLERLIIDDNGMSVDNTIISAVKIFHSLVHLNIHTHCSQNVCYFSLEDDDVEDLVETLPRLKTLTLGHPCRNYTCRTTIMCLLSISTCCIELERLEVHFRTTGFGAQIEEMLENPPHRYALPKCGLKSLNVHEMPLALTTHEDEEVSTWLLEVFPFLDAIEGYEEGSEWDDISRMITSGMV